MTEHTPPPEAPPPQTPAAPEIAAGERGFAFLAAALLQPTSDPAPPRRTRRRIQAPAQPATLQERLEAVEQLALQGHMSALLSACQALMPQLLEEGSALQRGICQHLLALALQYACRVREAVQAGYAALNSLSGCEGEVGRARQLRTLGLQAIAVARLGEQQETRNLLERAANLLIKVEAQNVHCVFWNNAGAALHALGDLDAAREAAERAIALLPPGNSTLALTCRVNRDRYTLQQALVSTERSRLHSALSAMLDCIDTLTAEGAHHLISRAAELAVAAQMELNDHDAARALLLRCTPLVERAGLGNDRGVLELHLARLERLQGRHRSAAAHMALALQLLADSPELDRQAQAHLEQSELCEAQGHWRAALDSYKRHAEAQLALLRRQAEGREAVCAARQALNASAGPGGGSRPG